MKTIVKGIERSVGKTIIEGKPIEYDNIILHCLVVNDSPIAKLKMLAGMQIVSQEVKLKNDFAHVVFVGEFTPVVKFEDLVDCEILVHYDPKNNRAQCVEVKGIGVAL